MTSDVDLAPLAGSVAGLTDVAGAASRAAAALGAVRGDLVRLDGLLTGHRSIAVAAAQERLARLAADVALCADVLGTAAGVLARRAAGLAGEQDDAARALTSRADALTRLARAQDDEALALGADPLAPLADTARDLWDARVRAAQAREDLAAAEHAWRTARDAKDTASRAAAPLLDGLADAPAVAASAAHGVGAAGHADAWRRGQDLAASLAAAGPAAARADRLAARVALLDAIVAADGDVARWTAFWESASPADLYAALGDAPPDPAALGALGGGLSAWASSATRAERHDLGHRLVAELGLGTASAGSRTALLGELLGSSPLPGGLFLGAADALVARRVRTGQDDAEAATLAPVSVGVAGGLAAHPAAALDHLAPRDRSDLLDRSLVWFGMTPRDGWPDGGVAVTGMLAAAVAVGSRGDLPTQGRTAVAVSAATTNLVGDRGLLAGTSNGSLAAAARANVVDAYRPSLGSIGENVALTRAGAVPAPGLLQDAGPYPTRAPGTDVPWPTAPPRLDTFALREVVAATSASSTDADRWLLALDDHVAEAAAGATGGGIDDHDRQQVVENTLSDVSFVAGAIRSTVIGEAAATDARAGGTVTAATLGLSIASAPASAAVSLAATGVGSVLPALVPQESPAARAAVLATEPGLRDRYAGPLYEAVVADDVAGGATPQEAAADNAALLPSGDEITQEFGANYDLGSGLGRQLGEAR